MTPADARNRMANVFIRAVENFDWSSIQMDMPIMNFQGRDDANSDGAELASFFWKAGHVGGQSGSLTGENGLKRWENSGLITIQCKAPNSTGRGFEVAEVMAIITRNAYRAPKADDCVIFRNVRFNEVGTDDGWYIFNVFAEFEYDEVS